MANRFFSPNQQFINNLGVPLEGGKLYFYATGSSTPLTTYSDSNLTIANTNPIILDSDGCAGEIFLQNLAYKVTLDDADDNQIWTADPVWSSDYSTLAKIKPWSGNPNGSVAGIAGTQGALPGTDAIWDYTNNILYMCTTTGNVSTTVWTAVNSTSTTATVLPPQGYLTVNSDVSNPVTASDTTSSIIYYSPFVGSTVPVYNGTAFASNTFTQLTLTLTAAHTVGSIYDVFVFNNSGVLTLVTGPAWTTATAGSGARGTGGGSTAITRLSGLFINQYTIVGTNGASTYNINANTATFLGSIYINSGGAGTVTCHRSYGASRVWGVSNAYNTQPVAIKTGVNSATWTSTGATVRPANNDATVTCRVFQCLPIMGVETTLQWATSAAGSQGTYGRLAIGWNTTTAFTGVGGASQNSVNNGQGTAAGSGGGVYTALPTIGINNVTELENSSSWTMYGTETGNCMTCKWWA